MLELCYFDFSPFGQNKQTSNVKGLLSYIHNEGLMDGFENFPALIAVDICSGVRYLHNNGVAH